uniref:PKD domain-containing protein n=1 Tax=uncultured marine thaumarchaeote SAT1000_22_D06 TaxID=1456395 RepID=A0A075I5S3_9ARCH|nr:PKD domain-containing protein [uncultured marine thaumarchaeote SAT1000_22_D06]
MKNEIGRKLTSLTIMAIMFAGGMAIGVPSFMPEAASDLSVTEGLLTVSSTTIQGAAILEIVVNDPDYSDTTVDISSTPSVDFGTESYPLNQAVNGKWYLYIVDNSQSVLMDGDGNGQEFGIKCVAGLSINESTTDLIVPAATGKLIGAWASMLKMHTSGFSHSTALGEGSCLDADGMVGVLDSGTTAREDLSAAVLTGAPSLSNHDDSALGATGIDMGQRGHGLNASGYGSWPYILAIELQDDNVVGYGGDSINVAYGNTDDETSIELANRNPAELTEVHLTITDPALNIDPTGTDIWVFDLDATDAAPAVKFANNGTNAAFIAAEMGEAGFVNNGRLASDAEGVLATGANTVSLVTMTETGSNTGVFESFDTNGDAQFTTTSEAAADTKIVFSYGGNSVDMIITYNDATISLDAGGDWSPGQSATISVNDPDQNRNPTSAETLSVGDETAVIPTIKMGTGGLTLAEGTGAAQSAGAITTITACVTVCIGTDISSYSVNIFNTTDNSERLRIFHSAEEDAQAIAVETWINVTTGHSVSDIINLTGTTVLSYDISAPADLVSSTAISVFLTSDGNNSTDNVIGSIDIVTAGNVKSGVYDLEGSSTYGVVRSADVSSTSKTWVGTTAQTAKAGIAFKMTHPAGSDLAADADYAIYADFCNFDQDNSSLTHNCMYRLEAVETGDNTGIFEGTVEYINMTNSTTGGSTSGEHDGNDHEVEGLLGYVKGDALSVVLMDSVSGSDSVRVVYNDTDAFQVATKIGAQLETSTHTADISLDADTYGASDIATITVVDADLNTDSAGRDTYKNSTTTFQMTIEASGSTVSQKPFAADITLIETGDNTGVFIGTFAVPDFKGSDMELVYYDAKDAGGSAVQYFDTATVTSASGSVSFDRSVYPVPWTANDLYSGAGTQSVNTEAGAVTVWITVEDADMSDDTLTTAATTADGTILIKHTNSTGSVTLATAGSIVATDASTSAGKAELGPLSEVSIGSSTYEISLTVSETMIYGGIDAAGAAQAGGTNTIQAGDVITVEYVDTADSAGSTSTFYDSSTFDLRTGTLSVDKDVYVMGSDMVITVTDPDLNLDSTSCESYAMSLIEWDSAADSSVLLSTFTSNPSSLEETGCDTGVFQTVTTIPVLTVGSGNPEYGESVTLTYVDAGLSGETDVAGDKADIETTFSISNFGAIVELDKALYNWTDTVYITITAPDHNNNSAAEETIGTTALPIQVTSRSGKMCTSAQGSTYAVAAETGPDTGVFTMEVALTGYSLSTANNNPQATANTSTCSSSSSTGHDLIMAGQTDGVSVSYEYTDAVVVVASASVAFNIAEAGFDTSSASAGGSAVMTVTDADENTNSAIIDTFTAAVFSDSDNGGFTLTLAETDEDTGVFEGTVFFTSTDATSGSNLRVSEGDTVTAEYSDTTLPEPYTDSDSLTVASTLTIGTAFPPLERAPAANARVVDAFGSSVAEVSVGQQVQIAADVSNGQSGDQAFAYLVQVQDGDGVTVSLAWITGSLTAGQSMSPALSWTPSDSGSYTATVFVWESVDNPTALSPTTSVSIDVV